MPDKLSARAWRHSQQDPASNKPDSFKNVYETAGGNVNPDWMILDRIQKCVHFFFSSMSSLCGFIFKKSPHLLETHTNVFTDEMR